MRRIIAMAATLLASSLTADELPVGLAMRIGQMEALGTTRIETWPDDPAALFQGLRKTLPWKVESRKDHARALATIPKNLLAGRKVGETIEKDGWFYSSLDSREGPSTWLHVIATRKGGNEIRFSYTW